MAFDRFLIAPMNTGLQTDLKPWLIMDDGFAELNNAYVFRGRVRKRFGETLMGYGWPSANVAPLYSRLRINIGTTDAGGSIDWTIAPLPGTIFNSGQMFSIGTEMFTVISDTPGNQDMLDTGGAITATFDVSNGHYTITGSDFPLTAVWFYPAEPVMGLTNYEVGAINNQPSIAFDTQFAYLFAGGFWQKIGPSAGNQWHGTNNDFFWATNWRGTTVNGVVLYVTNFYVVNKNGAIDPTDDPVWYYDGTTWTAFTPEVIVGAINIETARIILPFKGRLLMLNTIETDGVDNFNYVNRCRFSQVGNPLDAAAWLETPTQVGSIGGGFVDAATEEAIVSAEFIKDRLIVYFERSTWELAFTGNNADPFLWQKINTELGSESTFSTVPFDKQILTIGNTGVHACNGANVERIDNKIPNQIFDIVDKNAGVQRVAGIRDYFTELVYWTFPSTTSGTRYTFPTQVLVYNYRNGSWSINDDCITTFGYFEQQLDVTWASTTLTWEQYEATWGSGVQQAQFRQVIAGNQQGYVFIVNPEVERNAPVMQITNIANVGVNLGVQLTIINHTLEPGTNHLMNQGDYVAIEYPGGVTGLSGRIFKVKSYVDANNVIIDAPNITGTYTGGGVATRVSNIQILSKQWNPYDKHDRNVYLAKIDFNVDTTASGAITVDYFPSSTELSMIEEGGTTGTNSILGTNVLETFPYADVPLEFQQTRVWHPIYFQTQGECIQIFMSMDPEQMTDTAIAWQPFELNAMILYTQPTTDRMQ